MPATIVITGANGFVGRVLADEALRRGHTVRAVVRDLARASGVRGEVIAVPDFSAAAGSPAVFSGADAVVHLAARVHVMKEHASDPLAEFRRVNVGMTEALARAAAAHGAKRFVYVSSIKVNGEETTGRSFSPHDRPAPLDPYGISKREAEDALKAIADATAIEVTVVRPPLIYGPGVGGNFLRLLKLVARGVPLPFGCVVNRRSMIYNRNLADALLACAVHPNAAGRTFLLSDGEDLSTPDLVRRMGAALGTNARLLPVPPALLHLAGRLTGMTGEVRRLVSSLTVDSDFICDELAWSAPFAVAEGLLETAQWYRTQNGA